MSIEPVRARIKGGIWQAAAQSGVDLSKLSADEQNRLVDAITENMLLVVNEVLDEVAPSSRAAQGASARPPAMTESGAPVSGLTDEEIAGAGEEQVLWEGRPFLSVVEFYTITDERIKIVRGLFGRDVENFELIRIQDIDYKQNMSERLLGIGDINIRGADPSSPRLVLRNINDPQAVYELLRRAWLNARKKHGLVFREEM